MTTVVLVNLSNLVTSVQLQNIITGLNVLLVTFANDWKLGPAQCVLGSNTTPGYKMYILNNTDAPGALGYHDESSSVPYGRVFVQTILGYGGTVYTDVSKCIAHEVFELLVDPYCNMWWQLPDGTMTAGEVCDAVENNNVVIKVGAQNITYSDWVLPKWTDRQAKSGPFNHLNTLTKPFSMSRGGYLIKLRTGAEYEVFGEKPKQCLRSKKFT